MEQPQTVNEVTDVVDTVLALVCGRFSIDCTLFAQLDASARYVAAWYLGRAALEIVAHEVVIADAAFPKELLAVVLETPFIASVLDYDLENVDVCLSARTCEPVSCLWFDGRVLCVKLRDERVRRYMEDLDHYALALVDDEHPNATMHPMMWDELKMTVDDRTRIDVRRSDGSLEAASGYNNIYDTLRDAKVVATVRYMGPVCVDSSAAVFYHWFEAFHLVVSRSMAARHWSLVGDLVRLRSVCFYWMETAAKTVYHPSGEAVARDTAALVAAMQGAMRG